MAVKVGRDESVVEESRDSSLETLQPVATVFEYGGTTIEVKPFTFGSLMKALKHISNIAVSFQGQEEIEVNLLWAFANHSEDIVSLMSLSTGLPVEFYDTIPSDLGVDVAMAVYQVNESFFTKNLLPKLQANLPSDSLNQPTAEEQEQQKKAGSKSSKS